MIDNAARLWRSGFDTLAISLALSLPESRVYNSINQIRRASKSPRVSGAQQSKGLAP